MAELRLCVNGEQRSITTSSDDTLAVVLREHLRLVGTVIGCGRGECGSCTVLVDRRPVRACVAPAGQFDGADVLTVEGLAAADGTLHPMQESFLRHGAVQCGFCTPGMLLSAVAASEQHAGRMDETAAREAIATNLCRCTGYASIVAAIVSAH